MNSSSVSKKELIGKYIKKGSVKGKITCSALRKIAEKLGTTYKVAGQTADDLNIKIKNCDLGCF